MSSAAYLSDILLEGKIDMCGLSEHWLITSFFLTLSSDYDYFDKCDSSYHIKGGVALMWKKRLSNFIVPINIDDDRIVGIQLQIAPSENIFFYFKYICHV